MLTSDQKKEYVRRRLRVFGGMAQEGHRKGGRGAMVLSDGDDNEDDPPRNLIVQGGTIPLPESFQPEPGNPDHVRIRAAYYPVGEFPEHDPDDWAGRMVALCETYDPETEMVVAFFSFDTDDEDDAAMVWVQSLGERFRKPNPRPIITALQKSGALGPKCTVVVCQAHTARLIYNSGRMNKEELKEMYRETIEELQQAIDALEPSENGEQLLTELYQAREALDEVHGLPDDDPG